MLSFTKTEMERERQREVMRIFDINIITLLLFFSCIADKIPLQVSQSLTMQGLKPLLLFLLLLNSRARSLIQLCHLCTKEDHNRSCHQKGIRSNLAHSISSNWDLYPSFVPHEDGVCYFDIEGVGVQKQRVVVNGTNENGWVVQQFLNKIWYRLQADQKQIQEGTFYMKTYNNKTTKLYLFNPDNHRKPDTIAKSAVVQTTKTETSNLLKLDKVLSLKSSAIFESCMDYNKGNLKNLRCGRRNFQQGPPFRLTSIYPQDQQLRSDCTFQREAKDFTVNITLTGTRLEFYDQISDGSIVGSLRCYVRKGQFPLYVDLGYNVSVLPEDLFKQDKAEVIDPKDLQTNVVTDSETIEIDHSFSVQGDANFDQCKTFNEALNNQTHIVAGILALGWSGREEHSEIKQQISLGLISIETEFVGDDQDHYHVHVRLNTTKQTSGEIESLYPIFGTVRCFIPSSTMHMDIPFRLDDCPELAPPVAGLTAAVTYLVPMVCLFVLAGLPFVYKAASTHRKRKRVSKLDRQVLTSTIVWFRERKANFIRISGPED